MTPAVLRLETLAVDKSLCHRPTVPAERNY